MAITVVQAGHNTSTTSSISAATKGNLLIQFLTASSAAALYAAGSDNISGSTGWGMSSATPFQGSGTLWGLAKTAVGGETTLSPTLNNGATVVATAWLEVSGLAPVTTYNNGTYTEFLPDVVGTTNGYSNGTASSVATFSGPSTQTITTPLANMFVVTACALSNTSGIIKPWTGTGSLTLDSTTSGKLWTGYYAPVAILTTPSFTANWTTARSVWGLVTFAFYPAVPKGGTLPMMGVG